MDIILMGTQKSGKTSIRKVVFEKMSPNKSIFNQSTSKIETIQIEIIRNCKISITEFPHNILSIEQISTIEKNYLKNCGTLIYVFDFQDNSNTPFDYFIQNIIPLVNHSLTVSIFIHKTDTELNLSNKEFEKKINEIKLKFNQLIKSFDFNYYITSIYDNSIFEKFSRIFRRTVPQLTNISRLVEDLNENCNFEKCYLFNVYYKIYIGVDYFPLGEEFFTIGFDCSRDHLFGLCLNIIDVSLEMGEIFNGENKQDSNTNSDSDFTIKIDNFYDKNKNMLYLRFIDSNLALIFLINEKNYKPHLLNYNIQRFIKSVQKLLLKK